MVLWFFMRLTQLLLLQWLVTASHILKPRGGEKVYVGKGLCNTPWLHTKAACKKAYYLL